MLIHTKKKHTIAKKMLVSIFCLTLTSSLKPKDYYIDGLHTSNANNTCCDLAVSQK